MSKVAEYQELRKVADEAIKNAGLIFKDAIVEAIKPVFDSNYKIDEIAVVGYTPSYSDGDPCTFSMNTEDCEVNGSDGYGDDDEEDENYIDYKEIRSIQKKVSECLSDFNEDDWASAFNEYGFKVIFSRMDGGSISLTEEDYDCGY